MKKQYIYGQGAAHYYQLKHHYRPRKGAGMFYQEERVCESSLARSIQNARLNVNSDSMVYVQTDVVLEH